MPQQRRKPNGFSISVLFIIISVFAILPLGLLGFEIARFVLLQAQLQSVTEAATLAGTADLASEPPVDQATRQQNAANIAVAAFCSNTIMGTKFSTTGADQHVTVVFNSAGAQGPVPPAPGMLTPNQVYLYIALKDNSGNYIATGNVAASMQISAYMGCTPVFASSILPLFGTYIASAVSSGGLPKLDLVLCFDLSGSMDDSTKVYYVRRYWDATNQAVAYSNCNSSPDTIYNLENLATYPTSNPQSTSGYGTPTGTPLNVVPPQKLSWGRYYAYTFSDDANSPANPLLGLRANHSSVFSTPTGAGGLAEQSLPPGNYNPSNKNDHTYSPPNKSAAFPNSDRLGSNGQYTTYFTDVICAGIIGQTVNGFTFDSLATAVEASRGNLESGAAFAQAVPGKWSGSASPGSGWYQAYWSFVQTNQTSGMVPMSFARSSAENFLRTMSQSADSHFGLVCFSDRAGTSPTDTYTDATNNDQNNIDPYYPQGGQGTFPLPMISLNSTNDNCQACISALDGSNNTGTIYPPVGPLAGTNFADSLSCALQQLQTNGRPNARKAIIMFTDGAPSLGKVNVGQRAGSNFDQWPFFGSDVLANDAKLAGIPIYTIGLSQNYDLLGLEAVTLGDWQNGSQQGIAYRSGNGAKFWSVQVSDPQVAAANLNAAFQALSRALCLLN